MAIQAHLFPDNLCFPLLNSQEFSVENGRGFDHPCFAPQQLIQFDQFPNSTTAQFHQFTTIERQRFRFEQFLNSQNENERLRTAMQEQRKHQMTILMKKCEPLLQQKDEAIAKAADRAAELRTFMKRIEIENLTWQRAAEENEAMIASLSRRLRENGAGDAESCCRSVELIEEEKEKTVCRCCNSRNSCVVMLPCRHLCSCRDCEVFLDSCPVCSVVKKGAIEALV